MGEADAAGGTLAEIARAERDRAELRMTAAAIALAQGAPERAVDALAPVIEGKARALHPAWAPIEALLFDAAARDALGDRCAAEASIERALELAEPDGVILPFTLAPVRRAARARPSPPDRSRHPAHDDPRSPGRKVARIPRRAASP